MSRLKKMEFDPFTGAPIREESFYDFEKEESTREVYDGEPFEYLGEPVTTAKVGRTVVDHGKDGIMLNAVQAAARQGVRNMELTPNINGRAPRQGIESINNSDREQIRQYTKLNDINVTGVHVHPSEAGNLTGYNRQDGSFNNQFKNQQIQAIKKGIDFNADIDGGGVVFHTGEYPRSDWSNLNNLGDNVEFIPAESEKQQSNYSIIDKTTGKAIVIPENHKFTDSNIDTSKMDQPFKVDIQSRNWVELKKDFEENKDSYKKRVNEFFGELDSENKLNDINFTKAVAFKIREDEAKQIESGIEYHSTNLRKVVNQQNHIENSIEAMKKYESKLQGEELERVKKIYPDLEHLGRITQSEYYQEIREKNNAQIAQLKHEVESLSSKKTKLYDDVVNSVSAEEFGFDKSVNSLVDLAHYAKQRTDEANKSGKELSKPIYLAPENIFADDGFGSHPQEMKKLILEARQRFAEDLLEKKECKTYKEAYEKSKEHIRSTFDTSHLGMWYGNMKDKKGESTNQKIDRFKKWYLNQVEDTSKEDIYGGTHIVDGFTGHTHVDIGEGMHPVKEAIKIISKNTKGHLSLNSEAYENEDQISQIWDAFNLPKRVISAEQSQAMAHEAKQSFKDSSFAGIEFSGSWDNGSAPSWGAGMNSTCFNTTKSFPINPNDENSIRNWDNLPLE